MKLTLGFSTCPNDTFMFDALVNGRIETQGLQFDVRMEDILHLNRRAIGGDTDVVKVSYNTFGRIMDEYQLLRSGSAMGKGSGPLLVARPGTTMEDIERDNAVIAIPGFNTTANLLLSFFAPRLRNRREMLFHDVMPAVTRGEAKAGLLIHEQRFTYAQHGLVNLVDLGDSWEQKTGLPIPLGAIVARKSLGRETILTLQQLVRESVEFACRYPEASRDFVKQHAQEMDEAVCRMHIELYVNNFSIDFGADGEEAIAKLLEVGAAEGIMERTAAEKFREQMRVSSR